MAELRIYAMPTYLYRYRPLRDNLQREVQSIDENYVYCPTFSSMNDPMEGSHRLSLRMLSSATSGNAQQAVLEAQQRLGVASFSEVFDHEPMWAHYAGQFTGMCVQYHTRRLLQGLLSDVDLARMMYSEREPTILEDRRTSDDRAKMTLSNKTARWASEREWRIFRPEVGRASYSEKKTVTKIYLGARVSPADEELVRDLGRRHSIQVTIMKIDAYAMEFSSTRRLSQKARAALNRAAGTAGKQ
ncbi:DUF2971 domain-containing protein [Devosia sp. 1566]|uniref:DUF2971 domain-containing protein n=1 Tax=Devosia sp. 1566 TaxID=2499144 RepID=UPI000FDB1AD9|nr:DUF2971 domain-containing protein [Devosia sp. 1566]